MSSPVDYVDPRIGTDGAGNCLIGPFLPLSLVRLGPDTLRPQTTSGYNFRSPIVRFSHTHVSGTGGSSRYGNIGVTPFVGRPRVNIDPYEMEDEHTEAGYYRVRLMPSGMQAELTSTPRTGVHRYRFPAGQPANLLIDVGSVIQRDLRTPAVETGGSVGGFVEFISDTEIVGRGDFKGGWGHDFPYSVYFYARLDRPADRRMVAHHDGIVRGTAAHGPNCKAIAHFREASAVGLQVGVSYTSIANARASVDREIGSATFEQIQERARQTWNDVLSRIRVEGARDESTMHLFYTLMTRLLCLPSDLGVDDEFPLWKSGVRHFTDYYCLWDSVRNANSLITLFDPKLEVDMLNCLLDVAEHIGWLVDAWIAGHSAMIQGGSSADVLFCEAKLKGLEGIDYEKALKYMRKNAEVDSPDPWLYGRHLRDWRELGYLSTNVRKNCVSRHLEYAYQDWCIGRLAGALGHGEDAKRFAAQSKNVWNLWREDIRLFGPRKADGAWINPFDPASCLPDSWNDPYFYEGTSWIWSWNVQHDFAGLIERMGGDEGFASMLDRFFDEGHHDAKEIMLHTPYLYHYIGRPARSADRVAEALAAGYTHERRGLVDNEDMGCQSAFFMCSTLGLYPLMGQDVYWLTTPRFERSVTTLGESGPELVIEAPGASEAGVAVGKAKEGRPEPRTRYIVGATLNGERLDRAWLRHGEIARGGVLRFELADQPGDWGRGERPPSPLRDERIG